MDADISPETGKPRIFFTAVSSPFCRGAVVIPGGIAPSPFQSKSQRNPQIMSELSDRGKPMGRLISGQLTDGLVQDDADGRGQIQTADRLLRDGEQSLRMRGEQRFRQSPGL